MIRLILLFYSCLCVDFVFAVGEVGLPAEGKIIDTVICKADARQSYALYMPVRGNGSSLPVVFFFDPHGNGALPLRKYRSLADAYGFILAGSNNSRNGNDWSMTETVWRSLLTDVQTRLKINGSRIYVCGFSGGAKAASYLAVQHHEVRGVVVGGSGLPDGMPASDLPFALTTIAGEGDMNLTDLVNLNHDLDRTRTRHHIIYFNGKHEWAPKEIMDRAFEGLELDAMQSGMIPRDAVFIGRNVAKGKKRIASYYEGGQFIKAWQECGLSMSFLDGLTAESGWFKEKASSIAGNVQYQKQRQIQDALLTREQGIKAEYMQQFQQGDLSYWNRVIADLNTKASAKTVESAMDQRLLAYLSLAFYSISNHLIGSNENKGGRHFVELYKRADPSNSEAWYFSAVLHVREGQPAAAEADLLKAVEYGFRDRARLEQQPEFKGGPHPIDLSGIERKMTVTAGGS